MQIKPNCQIFEQGYKTFYKTKLRKGPLPGLTLDHLESLVMSLPSHTRVTSIKSQKASSSTDPEYFTQMRAVVPSYGGRIIE